MKIATRMTLHPRYGVGGAQRQMEFIGRNLAKMGVRFYYLTKKIVKGQKTHENYGNFSFDAILGWKFLKKKLTIKEKILDLLYSYEIIVFLRYFRFLNQDIFHLRGAKALVGIWAFFIKIIKRKKLIFTAAHINNCIPNSYSMSKVSYKIYEYGLRKADIIIVLANYMKKALYENYGLKSIVVKSGHPIPPSNIKKENPPIILWISRLMKFKRPEIFLKIAEQLNHLNVKFILIGNGNYKKKEIEDYAKNNEFFFYIPNIPMNKDKYYYEKASLLINTSINEGFPNSFIQAWLYKTPVISLDVDPDNEISNNNLGYFTNGNLDKMIEKIEELIQDPEKLMEIGKKCRLYAIKNYNIKKTVDYHFKVYNWLLRRK
ncbi:MAG: glycosyltransferase family 4 protein [Promethearchaeota archaeon]